MREITGTSDSYKKKIGIKIKLNFKTTFKTRIKKELAFYLYEITKNSIVPISIS